ncbi:MAG: tRNA lysidine(34) synthetase TilS [Planctomycetales bacterium]|nr:tRNA lysidine(34) synthetase TilS [Planctomycetales bacterium]
MNHATLPEKILANWPADRWERHVLTLAVSGGADSVALLRSFSQLQPDRSKLVVVHVNHGLRATAADEDQQFVAELCQAEKLSFVSHRIDPRQLQANRKDGLEGAARTIRYQMLLETANQHGSRYVLTAHNADDQVETVLHHLFRGTGLAGLAGMSTFRLLSEAVTLARPLLTVSRAEIESWLASIGQCFRQDDSNQSDAFARNRIRHNILPVIERELGTHIRGSILKTSQIMQDAVECIDAQVVELLDQNVVSETSECCTLDADSLQRTSLFLRAELFRALWKRKCWSCQTMSRRHWLELAMACDSLSAKQELPGQVRYKIQDNLLVIEKE